MDWSSWFRRNISRTKAEKPTTPNQHTPKQEGEELLGVTLQLVEQVKSFTVENFKNYPLQDEGSIAASTYGDEGEITTTTSANVKKDLSEWQERHATFVLSKVKELSQLRFTLCPRHLKERDFWRIYFSLVKSHVAEYELQAIREAKLKRMAMENEKTSVGSAVEVEMAETNTAANLAPSTP